MHKNISKRQQPVIKNLKHTLDQAKTIAAAISAEDTWANAAEAAIQADVDQNEADADAALVALEAKHDAEMAAAAIATTAEISQAISDLVDGAPGVLDTLNEIAAAIEVSDTVDFVSALNSLNSY